MKTQVRRDEEKQDQPIGPCRPNFEPRCRDYHIISQWIFLQSGDSCVSPPSVTTSAATHHYGYMDPTLINISHPRISLCVPLLRMGCSQSFSSSRTFVLLSPSAFVFLLPMFVHDCIIQHCVPDPTPHNPIQNPNR